MATKLRLHNTASFISGYKCADLSLGPKGSSVSTSVTNTSAAGTDIQCTDVAGGTILKWITEPLASGFTLSGTVTANIYGGESNAAANVGLRVRLFKYSGGVEGSSLITADMGTELTTTLTTANNWTGSPSSTLFAVGDRVVIKLFITNIGTMGGSFTVTLHYEGDTDGTDGSSWIQLNETISVNPEGGSGGTPTLVQWVAMQNLNNSGQTITAGGNAKFALPGLTGSSNAITIFMWAQVASAGDPGIAAISITDDGGNIYNLAVTGVDGNTGGQRGYGFYALNIVSGTRVITVTSTVALSWFTVIAQEWTNIATASALDCSSANCPGIAGTAITAGSMTPTVINDLLLQYTWNELGHGNTPGSYAPGLQANTTWKMGSSDIYDSTASQYGVYNSTLAINPTFSQGNSVPWNSIAFGLKASAAGTPEVGGMHIFGIQHHGISAGDAATFNLQFSAKGNLVVMAWSSGSTTPNGTGPSLTSMSSTPSNTWVQSGTTDDLASNITQVFYAANASVSNAMTIGVVLATTASFDSTGCLMDIVGAATAPFDTQISTLGNKSGTTNLSPTSITPTTPNGIIVALLAIDFNTVNAVSGGPILQNGFLSVNNVGNTPFDQNNGFASYANPNTSAVTFTWSFMTGLGANVGNWSYRATAFKAAAQTTGIGLASGQIGVDYQWLGGEDNF